MRKRKRLMKVGEAESVQERVAAQSTGPGKKEADRGMVEPSVGEGTDIVIEEGQVSMPLVLVPFEVVPKEEAQAWRK